MVSEQNDLKYPCQAQLNVRACPAGKRPIRNTSEALDYIKSCHVIQVMYMYMYMHVLFIKKTVTRSLPQCQKKFIDTFIDGEVK